LVNIPDKTLNSSGYIYNGTIDLKAGKYTLSIGESSQDSFSISIIGESGTLVSGSITLPFTFTINEKATSLRLYSPGAGTFKNIMIEQGTTATSYVEHKEQNLPLTLGNIELNQIGKYKDYFYKKNGKWYLHKEILKKIYNGTENWKLNETYNCPSIPFGEVLNKKPEKSLSNYFIEKPVQLLTTEYGMYTKYSGTLYVGFPNATITEFKTWLSIHNLIVYIGTDTPTDTEITDTTLISQLNAIENAMSYYGQTHISSTSDEISAIIEANAVGDLNLILS
jgi:hypothetical protein